MTEEDKLKALGKKPKLCHHEQPCLGCATVEVQNHYRQTLLEAADEVRKGCYRLKFDGKPCDKLRTEGCWLCELYLKLRISAGVEE